MKRSHWRIYLSGIIISFFITGLFSFARDQETWIWASSQPEETGETHEPKAEETEEFWHEEEEEEYHGHIGEHGGQFGDASDMYHYEVLWDDKGDVRVYIYDGEANPIMDISHMEVRWTLNPDAEYPLTGVLALSEDKNFFVLDLPQLTSSNISVKIEAEKEGRWWPVEFLLSQGEQKQIEESK